MTKSKIEWLRDPTTGEAGFSINPVKGLCPVACDYCYARRMYKRFHWNPEIRFEPILASQLPKKPSKIFVGSTIELFDEWIDAFWLDSIFKSVRDNPQHTFIFLTKRPENLRKFSPFPGNYWVGTSITGKDIETRANWMHDTDFKAKLRFASFEPLLTRPQPSYLKRYIYLFDWVIIGQVTPIQKATMPKKIWIDEITNACDKAGIPVFQKNNLIPIMGEKLRQEFPLSKPTG